MFQRRQNGSLDQSYKGLTKTDSLQGCSPSRRRKDRRRRSCSDNSRYAIGRCFRSSPANLNTASARRIDEKIKKKGGAGLKAIKENLIDQVWKEHRDPRPNEKVKVHDIQYAGQSIEEKLTELRKDFEKNDHAGFVVSMLDEVAWIFNLRGNDIPYNPVFFAYATVTDKDATLYIDDAKLTDEAKEHLKGVTIRPYEAVFEDASALAKTLETSNAKLTNGESKKQPKKYAVSKQSSWALIEALGGKDKVDEVRSPIAVAKAVKNDVELEGMRACHIRDGAALTEYFAWLEDQLLNKDAKLDEVDAADKLEQIRSKHDKFVGLSFDTISSTGANAAVIHYKPEKGACSVIDPKAIYLCDSGGQYFDGTTDTTRTIHFTEPTEMEKKAYTLVLQGCIALEQIKFPKGMLCIALDTLARQFLWDEGLDYRHGTGHGVGSYLNVHEGPVGVGTTPNYADVKFAPGNVISDEPGYYEDGKFGIRIENIIMVKEVTTNHKFGDKPFLGFEHVTMVPMCRKLIVPEMLSEKHRKWLNDYHEEVYDKTKGFFEKDELSMAWLHRETRPI